MPIRILHNLIYTIWIWFNHCRARRQAVPSWALRCHTATWTTRKTRIKNLLIRRTTLNHHSITTCQITPINSTVIRNRFQPRLRVLLFTLMLITKWTLQPLICHRPRFSIQYGTIRIELNYFNFSFCILKLEIFILKN